MKREEEKVQGQTTSSPRQATDAAITSASVENAHAAGDGAVKKTDETLPNEDNNETSTDTAPY